MEINYFEWRVPRAVPGRVSPQDRQILTWPSTSFLGFPGVSDGKESACSAGDLGLIPRLGRSPGEENGYPLQQSCLEKIMDRGAWQATGLQSLGLQRVGHDGATSVCTRTHTHKYFPAIFISGHLLKLVTNWSTKRISQRSKTEVRKKETSAMVLEVEYLCCGIKLKPGIFRKVWEYSDWPPV